MSGYDPFLMLGLPARPDLTDDDVRAAWRRVAAATHPDLPDGGDPARFATAAAAYADLRTTVARTEAYADLTTPRSAAASSAAPQSASLLWRTRHGRPGVLAIRMVTVAAAIAATVAVAGWQPGTVAIAVGILTWLTRTARYDLASV
jgi:hypothetical protein